MQEDTDRLADEITELAAHIAAATCRWLELVAEFDRREGWSTYGCKSCAHWLSWKCSLSLGPAREHVRVARRLAELPLVRDAFARGELTYSKVRALTRMEDVEREEDLLYFARAASASQLERAVRAYRAAAAVTADPAAAFAERSLDWFDGDDGVVTFKATLPADEAALVIAAIERVREERDAQHRAAEVERDPAVEPAPESRGARRADALVAIAVDHAAHGRQTSTGGDRCEVVVHVQADVLERGDGAGETLGGAPIPGAAVRRLCCDAGLVTQIDRDKRALSVGRRTRSIPPHIRRAVWWRDRGCRFPGCCETRHVDAHHIVHWADGGDTSLDNLVLLCRYHHHLVHEGGYSLTAGRRGALHFRRPGGATLREAPRLRRGDCGQLRQGNHRRGARPGPGTPVPTSGDRMDLGLAVDALLRFAPPPEPPGPFELPGPPGVPASDP